MPARALPAHKQQRDAVVADGVIDEVFADVVAIPVRLGIRVFGCEAVSYAYYDEIAGVGEEGEVGVLGVVGLEDPAAAVNVLAGTLVGAGVVGVVGGTT